MIIRDIHPAEHRLLGGLIVDAYSGLEGFPSPEAQPDYYRLMANIGDFTWRPGARVLVAVAPGGAVLGGVVYFGDMSQYGAGGIATLETNASGIRLLGVDPRSRGRGVGRALSTFCIELARAAGHGQVILHTTSAMRVAWRLYETLGFRPSPDLDFLQQELPVYGFRLSLHH